MKSLISIMFTGTLLFSMPLKVSVKPVDNEVYKKECGSCHFAYPAGLLPSISWKKVMNNLDNHFGDDASVDEKAFVTISSYLQQNSAEKSLNYKRSKKIVQSLNNQTPIAITQTPYIKEKHKKIKENLITQKDVKGLFNCIACHKNGEKGIFSDKDVDIPNYGKWEK